MKNAYESSSLLMLLQGFVSSSVETSNYTNGYDLKSVVLSHEVVCDWMLMISDVCSRVKSGATNTPFNT